MNCIPIKRSPSPTIPLAIYAICFFLVHIESTTPIATRGNANASILNAIICAVTVVPILAPIMIPIACMRFNIPEFTKLTVITVVPVDD